MLRPAVVPTQPFIRWVPGLLSWGGWRVRQITGLHLVPRLRRWKCMSTLPYAVVACTWVGESAAALVCYRAWRCSAIKLTLEALDAVGSLPFKVLETTVSSQASGVVGMEFKILAIEIFMEMFQCLHNGLQLPSGYAVIPLIPRGHRLSTRGRLTAVRHYPLLTFRPRHLQYPLCSCLCPQ